MSFAQLDYNIPLTVRAVATTSTSLWRMHSPWFGSFHTLPLVSLRPGTAIVMWRWLISEPESNQVRSGEQGEIKGFC